MKITELKTKILHSRLPYEKPMLACLTSTISTEGKFLSRWGNLIVPATIMDPVSSRLGSMATRDNIGPGRYKEAELP
jgi:hypothetical protein